MSMPKLDFRDGEREVPEHIRDLLLGTETYTLTYQQALEAINKRLLRDRLDQAQTDLIRQHRREFPWE